MNALDHMNIFTRARAIEQAFVIPDEAVYVCILYRDGVAPEGMSFGSLATLHEFIQTILPVDLFAQGATDEVPHDLFQLIADLCGMELRYDLPNPALH